MKTLIVCQSIHKGNTKKIADEIAKTLGAEVATPSEADIKGYDLIGFASGIYYGNMHRTLIDFAKDLADSEKDVFIFSTAGFPLKMWHSGLRKILQRKGFRILDEFCCKGHDDYSIFKLFGGLNKGRPDKRDLDKAKAFAQKLKGVHSSLK